MGEKRKYAELTLWTPVYSVGKWRNAVDVSLMLVRTGLNGNTVRIYRVGGRLDDASLHSSTIPVSEPEARHLVLQFDGGLLVMDRWCFEAVVSL